MTVTALFIFTDKCPLKIFSNDIFGLCNWSMIWNIEITMITETFMLHDSTQ